MNSHILSIKFILIVLLIGSHTQKNRIDSDCKYKLGNLFWNTSIAYGIEVHYKHEFFAVEQIPPSLDLAVEIYLVDTFERTKVSVESVAIFLPQALKSVNSSIAHELEAYFFSEDLGQNLKCSWPFDSYVLLTNLGTVDHVNGIEFAVTDLPCNTDLQLYIRFNLKDREVVHANINLRTPEKSPIVRQEFFYPNATDYLDDYAEGHDKVIRRRQAQSILDLRRGRRPKRPLQPDDPVYKHLLARKIHENENDEDYDAKPTALKPSKRKGLYTIDLHAPKTEKKKDKTAHRGISGKGTSSRDLGKSSRIMGMPPKRLKKVENEEEKASEDEDDDDDDDDDEMGKTGSRGSVRALDAIQDAKSADAYGNRTAEEYIIGTKLLYSTCGSNYSCFSYPEECNFGHNCYITAGLSRKGDKVHVVMAGATANWVAVGFSNDDKMGEDAIFICKRVPGSRRVSIWQAYNLYGKEAYSIGTVIQDTQNVIGRTGGIYNGILTCDMHIPLKFKTEKGVKFDLGKESYYILLAVGIRIVETKVPGGIQMHDYSTASSKKVFIGSDKEAEILPPSTHYAITIHEYLSLMTFGLFMPVGILFGRYGQSGFSGKMFNFLPSWLIVHLSLQGLSTILNVINFLTILIGRAGSAYTTGSSTYHAIIGILIFLASFANAGIGIAMLLKKLTGNSDELPESLRWAHWALGHTTYFFGAIELIRGAYLKKSFLVCSISLIAGYMLLFYGGANILLLFDTDLLRQKQELDESSFSSFIGPALRLKEEVPNEELRERKLMIICITLLLCVCTLFIIVQMSISVLGCSRLSDDYI